MILRALVATSYFNVVCLAWSDASRLELPNSCRYQLLGQHYGLWNKYHNIVVGNIEDGRKEEMNPRCSHVRISKRTTLTMALEGRVATPPFLMLDDHNKDFTPKAVLALVQNASLGTTCRANYPQAAANRATRAAPGTSS
jgi:hypothetical protein